MKTLRASSLVLCFLLTSLLFSVDFAPAQLLDNSPITPVFHADTQRGDNYVHLILRGDVSREILDSYGIQTGGRVGDIFSIRIAANQLQILNEIPGIDAVFFSRKHELLLNDSTSDLTSGADFAGCNADDVQSLGIDGSGVIIAIIDSTPFNWKHEDFTDGGLAGVRTRFIWQQTGTGGSTPSETGCNYGREYSQSDLQADNGPATTGSSHGTPCAGIAAGDGSASGGSRMGMAPAADIIYVQVDEYDSSIVDALSYLAQKADALNMPISVSMSLGTKYAICDGSDAISQAIDQFSDEGRSVSVACGNYYTTTDHAYGYATHGSPAQNITMKINGYSDTGTGTFDDYVAAFISYKQGDDFDVTVTSPSGTDYTTTVADQDEVFETPDGYLMIYHDSGPMIIVVVGDTYGTVTVGDEWKIDLSAPSVAHDDQGGMWSAYVVENHINGYFTTYQTAQYTLNAWASSQNCFSVGAHSKTSGSLYYQSSSGPTSDGRSKPDLTAPTDAYAPNTSSSTSYSSLCCTSGATPHVAGAIALIYQRYPDATTDEARQYLIDAAYNDTKTGAIPDGSPDNRWGYGKLNAYGAYEASAYQITESIEGAGDYSFANGDEAGAPTIADIHFNSEDIDKVTVLKHTNEFPPENPGEDHTVMCWFNISTKGGTSAFDCDLTLYYTDDELNNSGFDDPASSESRLVLYRYNGGSWVEMGGTVDTASNSVTLNGVSEFSDWCISDPQDTTLPSTLIDMMYSQTTGQNVLLQWEVELESDRIGYNILRADEDFIDEAMLLTASPIPAQNQPAAVMYQYLDESAVVGNVYYYWLEILEADGQTSHMGSYRVAITDESEVHPAIESITKLIGNYPNPFNPSTKIIFDLASEKDTEIVRLDVFNLKGQLVRSLFNGTMEPGANRSIVWDGKDSQGRQVSSGIYYYRLDVAENRLTGKALLLK